jgi:hypothetical protein
MRSRRRGPCALVLASSLTLVLVAGPATGAAGAGLHRPAAPGRHTQATGASGTRAAVCAAPAAGPAAAPAGAVTVYPGVVGDLVAKTAADPPGTTFWLAPGVHSLGNSVTAQVVPKDGDVYLGAPGAVLDGQGVNQFAFTQHATGVTVQYLTVRDFAAPQNQGVVNHDSGNGWTIADDVITANHGAALMAGANEQILRNCLSGNGQYGINAYQAGDGITNLLVDGNEIVGNDADNWESVQPGCGCSGGAKFWAVNGATIQNNWVHGNLSAGLWADSDSNDFLIRNNYLENNAAEALIYEISYNLTLAQNTIAGNTITKGKAYATAGDNFPVAAVYVSESGGDTRVPARTGQVQITGNLLSDNWAGITAWEDADRFCNSPANTSVGYCTKVGGGAALSTCVQPGIASAPLYGNCRWKTQNLLVSANTFAFDPTTVGCTNALCGTMGLLSEYGSYPSWSPYQGTVIEDAITFDQHNTWSGNTYTGPWRFVAHDTGTTLTAAAWTAAPYGQDAGSSFDTPAPPPPSGNVLDPATSGGEGGTGLWGPWYNATVQDTTTDPHSGSAAIAVSVTGPYGWGIAFTDYPGVPAPAGAVHLSYWARAATSGALGGTPTLHLAWLDGSGRTLAGTDLPAGPLTVGWAQATTALSVPAGAATAWFTLTGGGSPGDTIALDDIYLGP